MKLETNNTQSTKRVTKLVAQIKEHSVAHRAEMDMLKVKFEEMNANFELQNAKREIAKGEQNRLHKIIDELR